MTDSKTSIGQSQAAKAVGKASSAVLTECALCDKAFRKSAKLQRHLLEQHLVAVSVPVDSSHLEEGQRRAYNGVQEALNAANTAMQTANDGRGVPCPQCPVDRKEKVFKTALDLASHTISKHCDGLSDQGSDDEGADVACDTPTNLVGAAQLTVSAQSERVSVSRKRGPPRTTVGDSLSKRTKLLCVDVTKPTAIAPDSTTLPNPPPKPRSVPKREPEVVPTSHATKPSNSESRRPGRGRPSESDIPETLSKRPKTAHGAFGLERESHLEDAAGNTSHDVVKGPLLSGRQKEGSMETRADAVPQLRGNRVSDTADTGVPCHVASPESKSTPHELRASAAKPPLQSSRKALLSKSTEGCAAESGASFVTNAASISPGPTGDTAQRPGQESGENEAAGEDVFLPPSGLSSRIPARGFDIDFADMCDFPSSVAGPYYISRARKAQTGGL